MPILPGVLQKLFQKTGFLPVMCLMLCLSSFSCSTGDDNSTSTNEDELITIPDAALVRSLGEIATVPCDPDGSEVCQGKEATAMEQMNYSYPLTVAGLGIPLGGIGAGSFMINQSGTFGPWAFGGEQNGSRWENRILTQAAFHIREKIVNEDPTVLTLATAGPKVEGTYGTVADQSWDSPLSGWNLLEPGEGSYSALYPFGWIEYSPFETDVTMRFFSPIVPKNDELSSLPVAYFDMQLVNNTSKEITLSVMLTMPNATIHEGGTPETVRKGLSNTIQTDPETGITAVTMSADDPENTPDVEKSEWSIAVLPKDNQQVSYATSWNAEGDGSDIYEPFTTNGKLDNAPIDSSNSAGAICVEVTLAPGKNETINFALSWDFPQICYESNQTIWMRRYTNFYGAEETETNDYIADSYPFNQSFNIAKDALESHDSNLTTVEAWWSPLVNDEEYPQILRTAALNQLYQMVFKMPLWEGGLVSNSISPTLGKRLGTSTPGTHLFYAPDAAGGGNPTMGTEVGSNAYLTYNLFFPSIEHDRLLAIAEATMLDPNGNPGDWTLTNPFITWAQSTAPEPETNTFLDRPSEVIYRMYAYYLLNDDSDFLKKVYPAMKRQLTYLQGTIKTEEFLPRAIQTTEGAMFPAMPNTYNAIPAVGRDVYNSQLYLLALEVMIQSGQLCQETDSVIENWQSTLASAKSEFESVFWDSENNWYKYTEYTAGSSTHLATFYAQHIAELLNLGDLVDTEHYQTQLDEHYTRFMSTTDSSGRYLGASNMILPDGTTSWPILDSMLGVEIDNQQVEVWTGMNYLIGATYYAAGERFGDDSLKNKGIEMASAVATQVWEVEENGFAFCTPESWRRENISLYHYPGYERPLTIWESLYAIKPISF